MRQLSGLDSAFLFLETPNAPMHIGGVSILEPETAAGRLDFDRFRDFVAGRLPAVAAFRRRLAEVPLNLGRPYWVEDDPVDLDAHLARARLPAPGGWRQLAELAGRDLGEPLPRSRPLWKLTFVEGLETVPGVPPGAVAVLGKVHHAAVDGVAGVEILGALFDLAPGPMPAGGDAEEAGPEKHPRPWELLRETGARLLRAPLAVPDAVGQAIKAVAGAGAAWAIHRLKPPPMLWSAPKSPLNGVVSSERVWDGARLDLARIKAVKDAVQVTVNDVVLALCAGALRRYLEHSGALPERPLVAMVPVSVRGEEEREEGGNRVSAMLVSLATDEARPVRRLRLIHEGAQASKGYLSALGARDLTDPGSFIPFALAGPAARLYTGLHLAERHRPAFNLVITNVPGPQVPLYLGGARLLAHLGTAPIFDGIGLILPVFSYAGTLSIAAVSCPRLAPDLNRLVGGLEESLDELERELL